MTGLKRSLDDASHQHEDRPSPQDTAYPRLKPAYPTNNAPSSTTSSASSFRNVSACNRCRLRKNRCDQRLPNCASCEKAGVKCVGYDLITKREIPRSYVYYLESRVAYLESLLVEKGVPFAPAEQFNPPLTPSNGRAVTSHAPGPDNSPQERNGASESSGGGLKQDEEDKYDREKLSKLVSNIGMVSVQGASDPRFLGSTSGISFARVVFAAVKSSVSGATSERGSVRGAKSLTAANATDGGTTMRDSFFGLHTKPTFRQAPFPDREVGLRLVELYFEHANPQIPILHRGEFMSMFDRVYACGERNRTSRELYMLNIVFAIGAGIIVGKPGPPSDATPNGRKPPNDADPQSPSAKKRRLAGQQHQPEEYHASAIIHLENFLGSSPAADRPDGFGGGLEELQAVLLLAGFALLRPVAPGLWYIVGVAVRLGVDLGLHYEDGVGIDASRSEDPRAGVLEQKEAEQGGRGGGAKIDPKERGRREWVRDLRRRLWWCVYSFDRLVSSCVGRPVGITDQVITTDFPSMLDDRYITKEGFLDPPGSERPTYKIVAYHYFRLRLLQSEILQVLQHRQAQQARATGASHGNEFMHTKLPSPFLANFDSFRQWRMDIDRRLQEWKDSSPTQVDSGVQFSPLFLELNYWQAVIMLYRQSLAVPVGLAGEVGNAEGNVGSPSVVDREEREDEELVFLKVAEAGQKVLKLYRQLHRVHLVNYTFLATHHLFMAGISFLYAVWHSVAVRSMLSLDDVDFTVLAATSVLGDLIEKCPPAEACRDAFDRMSKATISMCMSTTGFGSQALQALGRARPPVRPSRSPSNTSPSASETDARSDAALSTNSYFQQSRRPIPKFDMNLRDLFSEAETDRRSFSRISNQLNILKPPPLMQHVKQEHQQQQMPPFHSAALKNSPPMPPHQGFRFDPAQRPQQPLHSPQQQYQQQQQHFSSPPPNPSVSASVTQSPYHQQQQQQQPPHHSQQQHQDLPTYPSDAFAFTDLDFLDGFTLQGGGGSSGADGTGTQDLGFDLGFLGDGTHDWSEGNGVDLFDGFFFGGSAAGAAGS
ncbi:uncharacterized protein EI97DRAFT_375681 [Westerdykella ornata]|uniref:Zn(2)-C6 fungal-type domain-containing protein n=1 Tax=Westerdykella ornata TaxID=318751 RepID=A0A6A6JQ68_WESOR|nr:uncharacterized protein EI97DRAFT_375681 [Westerdykella ornata]KAF2277109.1 hypothetical protein EI97DRAFT_375681 [Westerdykella ornata]